MKGKEKEQIWTEHAVRGRLDVHLLLWQIGFSWVNPCRTPFTSLTVPIHEAGWSLEENLRTNEEVDAAVASVE